MSRRPPACRCGSPHRNGGDFLPFIKPIEDVFADFPALHLKGAQERMYRNGVKLDLDRIRVPAKSERIR